MKIHLNLKWIVGMLLISLSPLALGQEKSEPNLSDKLHTEYKLNGVDQSLKMYEKLNTEKDYTGLSEPLNVLGYKLMLEDQDMDAAKKVFLAQIEEYSNEANPYDSYADLMLEMGNKDEAKENLQKSIDIAHKNDMDQEDEIYIASKTKLAKLENKHRIFDFMVGDYTVDILNFTEDKVTSTNKIRSSSSFDENGNILTVILYNQGKNPVAKRILVYDAVQERYDMAFISPVDPLGIRVSHIKVKDLGDNKVELMETFIDRKGKEHISRHEIEMDSEDNIEWVIFARESASDEWKKSTVKNYSKNT
jgi:tetratricopeptide (TPR) repeat protein